MRILILCMAWLGGTAAGVGLHTHLIQKQAGTVCAAPEKQID